MLGGEERPPLRARSRRPKESGPITTRPSGCRTRHCQACPPWLRPQGARLAGFPSAHRSWVRSTKTTRRSRSPSCSGTRSADTLVSKGTLSLDDTIGDLLSDLPELPPLPGRESPSGSCSTTPAGCRTTRVKPSGPRLRRRDLNTLTHRRNCSLTPTPSMAENRSSLPVPSTSTPTPTT
jgi:hypothetical protein